MRTPIAAPVAAFVATLSLAAAGALAQSAPQLERREFVIRDFRTESGVVLPEARVVYATLGTLNAAGDNAVLLPSHYMANINGYNWLIGTTERALDPTRQFLVLTELFGNGRSSSPSNTPEPFHGPRFPVTTIRDNVEAVHRLLTEQLKVTHLRAVVGFSMGAEQAFQWAVSHPEFVDAIVATSGTAKCHPHCYVRLEGQITALTTDPAWNGGDYTAPPTKGLEAFGMVWAGWLYSQEWWRQQLWRTGSAPGTTFEQVWQAFRRRFSADANDYILQARTWQRHDVGTTPGFNGDTERALRSIKARVLYMPSETDLYFPITDARYEQGLIGGVTFMPIPSLWGHTAGAASNPADLAFLNEHIGAFLGGAVASNAAIDRLIALIGERLAIAPDVARTKWNTGAPIEDRAREQQIVSAIGAGASAYDVPRATAERFFQGQIEASKIVQRAMRAQYAAARQPRFETVRDLDTEIRPVLDRLTPEMMRALGEALPVLGRPGGRQALEARSRHLTIDAPGNQAAIRAALAPLLDLSR